MISASTSARAACSSRQSQPQSARLTAEIAELTPPRAWKVRGTDGPIRGDVDGTVEPLGEGDRSRVTIALNLKGYGIGKVLLPLFVGRQARAEMPQNMANLKENLESAV